MRTTVKYLATAVVSALAVSGFFTGCLASQHASGITDTSAKDFTSIQQFVPGRKLQQGINVTTTQNLPGGITNTRGPDYVGVSGVNIAGGSTLPGGTSESGVTNVNFTTGTFTTGGPIKVAGVTVLPNTPISGRLPVGRKLQQLGVNVTTTQNLPGGITNTRGPDYVGTSGVNIAGGSTLPGGTSESGRTNVNLTTGTFTTGGPITVAGVPVIPNTPISGRLPVGRKLQQLGVNVTTTQNLPGGITNTRGPDYVGTSGVNIAGGSTLPGGTSESGVTNINFTTGTFTTGGPIKVAGVPIIPNTPISGRLPVGRKLQAVRFPTFL